MPQSRPASLPALKRCLGMSPTQTPPPGPKPYAPDTKRSAPRRLMLFIIPLAILALAVLLLGMHFLSGTK